MTAVLRLIDLAPELMFTLLHSACSDDGDRQPKCSEADRECERRTRQMTTSPVFSELMLGDLSADAGLPPVIYLLTSLMWSK